MTEITKNQAQNIQHCLGFTNGKKPKTFFRNYWVGKNSDNEELSNLGYMERYEKINNVCYRVLAKGLDLILGYGYSEKNKKKLLQEQVLFERDYEVQNEPKS